MERKDKKKGIHIAQSKRVLKCVSEERFMETELTAA